MKHAKMFKGPKGYEAQRKVYNKTSPWVKMAMNVSKQLQADPPFGKYYEKTRFSKPAYGVEQMKK